MRATSYLDHRAFPALLRLPPPPEPGSHALSGCCSPQAWAAARPSRSSSRCSVSSSGPSAARYASTTRSCRRSPGRSRCAMSRSAAPALISPCRRAPAAWRWRCCARRQCAHLGGRGLFRAAARRAPPPGEARPSTPPKSRADLATARPSRGHASGISEVYSVYRD